MNIKQIVLEKKCISNLQNGTAQINGRLSKNPDIDTSLVVSFKFGTTFQLTLFIEANEVWSPEIPS